MQNILVNYVDSLKIGAEQIHKNLIFETKKY
jgi:hypothetical protein